MTPAKVTKQDRERAMEAVMSIARDSVIPVAIRRRLAESFAQTLANERERCRKKKLEPLAIAYNIIIRTKDYQDGKVNPNGMKLIEAAIRKGQK